MNHFIKKISFLLFLIIASCNAQEAQKHIEIKYKAQTRGSLLQIVYDGHTIEYKNNSEEKIIILTTEEIRLLNEIVSTINVRNIKNLRAPSNDSSKDAAMIASFEFNNGKETFISSNFDHENPPKELMLLYQKLKALIQ